ncbi:hypothetical protein [Nocardioides humi]|uniref:hypothetical protein n=1 Tax=Nocardioides humi TaxID=449461 RepID=UPI001FEA3D37|nr:hypothetical protein [Nocardioides humi]
MTPLVDTAASDDPAEGLRAVVALRKLADRLEAIQVENARRLGWSWQEIADVLGSVVRRCTRSTDPGGRPCSNGSARTPAPPSSSLRSTRGTPAPTGSRRPTC